MSAWKIRLAIPSRDADLVAVALASRQIEDPEERAVARQSSTTRPYMAACGPPVSCSTTLRR
jgi:hypothetical protein